jgi:hypothetical protein
MNETSFEYQGRTVVITADDHLLINGKTIPYVRYPGGHYGIQSLAFLSFASLEELARALIDHGVG